jgi:hypothetical protein
MNGWTDARLGLLLFYCTRMMIRTSSKHPSNIKNSNCSTTTKVPTNREKLHLTRSVTTLKLQKIGKNALFHWYCSNTTTEFGAVQKWEEVQKSRYQIHKLQTLL